MIAIAPTDHEWFNFLRDGQEMGNVNFWTPTPWNLQRLSRGDRFYFLLKSPIRKIAGFGTFREYKNLTIKQAWNEFRTGNGVGSLPELMQKATGYARRRSEMFLETSDPQIGCVALQELVFLDDDEFFDPNEHGFEFSSTIVKLKYFDNDFVDADSLIQVDRMQQFEPLSVSFADYKNSKRKVRKGQSLFKAKLRRAYSGKCCVSGEICDLVLDACHIQPYLGEQSNHVQNGMLLRKDLHKLFDSGRLLIDDDFKVLISEDIVSQDYRRFHGKEILLPNDEGDRPSRKALECHRALFVEV